MLQHTEHRLIVPLCFPGARPYTILQFDLISAQVRCDQQSTDRSETFQNEKSFREMANQETRVCRSHTRDRCIPRSDSIRNRFSPPSFPIWWLFQNSRRRGFNDLGRARTGIVGRKLVVIERRRVLLVSSLDPLPVHPRSSLCSYSRSKIVVLLSDPAYHARTSWIVWTQGFTVEEADCAVEI